MTPEAPLLRGIEVRSIDYVPLRERHGRVGDQARFWFLGNFHFFTIAIGFIGPSMGLALGWTILAGALGILIGTVFQAFHASQGAEMGLPQMIQSRAQFGYRGVIVPLFATLFTYVGFNVVDTILIAGGLFSMAGWNKAAVSIIISAIGGALAIWGHDWLHRSFKILFWISVPAFSLLSIAIVLGLAGGSAPAPALGAPVLGFNAVAFFTQLAAGASYNITYATYVSDYSRYLPPTTPRAKVIASVFAGASLSAIWLIAVGAWLSTRLGASDALADLTQAGNAIIPGLGYALACVSIAALIATMGMNAYSGMLTVVTALDALRPIRATRRLRIINIIVLMIVSASLAIGFGGNAIDTLNGAFVIMLYLLVPWTAINLTDYFFVRRGNYAVLQLFTPSGIYGTWRHEGLLAYGLGFAVSLPFCVLPGVFTGPAAARLGGVDIGWLVGLATTAAIYIWLTRSFDVTDERQAIQESRASLSRLDIGS
jgi:purine-cytosine permease-like protein